MTDWIQKALALFGLTPVKPKPWEDPKRSAADRQAWRDAQPKSLK